VPSFPDPERLEYETLHSLVKFQGTCVLEIGAGDGRTIRHYANEAARVVGIDSDPYELEAARDDYLKGLRNVDLIEGRAETLPFPDASFDLVVFSWSLCCIAAGGVKQALTEALRVSRGTLLDVRVTVPPPEIWVRNRAGRDLKCGPLTRNADMEHNIAATQITDWALHESWFTVAAAREFDWIDAYESGDELIAEVSDEWENWVVGEDASLRLARTLSDAGRGAVPFIKQGVLAQLLKVT
jgi:SAM-dependent methyltransferase